MTNILTWDTKPIQLPKINSNLLSIVSLILLFAMVFLTVDAIASHCKQIMEDLAAAVALEGIAIATLKVAETALKYAGATGIPWLIKAAVATLAAAYIAVVAIGAVIAYLTVKLIECELEHGSENNAGGDGHAAGGCVTGGCVSGGCVT